MFTWERPWMVLLRQRRPLTIDRARLVMVDTWSLKTFHVHKNITHHTHVRVRVSHTRVRAHLTRYTHLPPLTRIPRFILGEVPCLGLGRADGRGSVVLIFALFREIVSRVILPFFWRSEGLRNYPRSMIRSLPSVPGRRGDSLPMPIVNSKGHNHRSDVPDKT